MFMERLVRERKALRRLPRSPIERVFHPRRRCTRTLMSEDPDARWECCPRWRRKLTNKWNSRVFAQRHGCRVPTLYWRGSNPRRLPFGDLPEAYAIRPIWGTSHAKNTFAMVNGCNLLDGATPSVDEMRDWIDRKVTSFRRFGRDRSPILVEEFIIDREGVFELPTEYKIQMFGDTVAVIQVVRRLGRIETRQGAYMPDWTPLPGGLLVDPPPLPELAPPHCLDEILACARRLGKAIETQVRLDFYASHAGAVFSELTFTPCGAKGFTAQADAYLGELWERVIPERP